MTKSILLACAVALAAAPLAKAAVSFDPTGGGGPGMVVYAVDVAPGNVLLTNQTQSLLQGYVTELDMYYQARVSALLGPTALPVYYPGGANPELTLTAAVHVGVRANGTTVDVLPGAPNMLDLFSDPANNANDLAGTGFTDGMNVLSGAISAGTGVLYADLPLQPMDQFSTDNYPGINELSVEGSIHLNGLPTGFDPAYFPQGTLIDGLKVYTSFDTPYIAVDPSAQFQTPLGAIAVGPNDMRLQSDGTMAINTVPEPASLGLLGLGALALLRRR